jgi:hypothetical protein
MSLPGLVTINEQPEVLFGSTITCWYQPGANTSSIRLVCTGQNGTTSNVPAAQNRPDTITFSNLIPGSNYTCSITPINANGNGTTLNYNPVVMGNLASAPQNLVGTMIGADVQLTWGFSSNNGLSPIGWYGITNNYSNDDRQLSNVLGNISTHMMFGVSTLAYYQTYTVQAVNSAGWGSPATAIAFNPAQLSNSMLAWHDAGSISGTTGTTIPTWSSRVVTRNAVSQNSSNHPTLLTNGLNGRNTVVYNTNQWHNMTLSISGGNYTFISMSRLRGGTNQRVFGDNPNNSLFGYWNNRQDVLYISGGNPNHLTGIAANTSWNLYSLSLSTTTAYTYHKFGTLLYSGASASGLLTQLSFNGIYNSGERSDCEIAESLVFSPQLSVANQQLVEGYLAWKYGFQTSLAASHPYRNLCVIPL